MDPTLSWIDASEVRAALAHVRRAGTPRHAASPQSDPAPTLAPVDALRQPATIAARIQALARWIDTNLQPKRWFIADAQGLAIHDAGFGEARIGELTHSMQQWRPDDRPNTVEAVTFHLAGGRRLVALWVRTPVGPAAIGLENPSTEALAVVRRAVEYAFKGRSHA